VDTASLLASVSAAVAERPAVDRREADSRERILEELERLESPFDRNAGPVHVTGSGILTDAGRILLLRHRKLGIWLQPGGHLEAGETPWDAARRETAEETGLVVELDGTYDAAGVPPLAHLDVHRAADGHTHLDLRYHLVARGDPTPRPPAGESQEVAWYDPQAAAALADPGLRGLIGWIALVDPW
jgi:8-oxo-dGTP pyrophosphatase MutT (NUDIX family)